MRRGARDDVQNLDREYSFETAHRASHARDGVTMGMNARDGARRARGDGGARAVLARVMVACAVACVACAHPAHGTQSECECVHWSDPRLICAPHAYEDVLDASAARRVRDAAVVYAQKHGWKEHGVNGGDDFETQAVSVSDLPEDARREVMDVYENKIIPLTREQCVIDGHLKFEEEEFFVVKYGGGVKSVASHKDGKHLSFIASLNNVTEYVGGGNVFEGLSFSVPHGGVHHLSDHEMKPLAVGGVIVHGANVKHSSVDVHSGERYVLVGIAYVNKSCCFDVSRFMNKWVTRLLILVFALVAVMSGATEWLRKKPWRGEQHQKVW